MLRLVSLSLPTHHKKGTPGSLGSFGSPMTLTGPSRDEGGEEEGDTEYEVVGMVRQKLLFKERPKPIVSRHLLQR
jgi:hypothetical protein